MPRTRKPPAFYCQNGRWFWQDKFELEEILSVHYDPEIQQPVFMVKWVGYPAKHDVEHAVTLSDMPRNGDFILESEFWEAVLAGEKSVSDVFAFPYDFVQRLWARAGVELGLRLCEACVIPMKIGPPVGGQKRKPWA